MSVPRGNADIRRFMLNADCRPLHSPHAVSHGGETVFALPVTAAMRTIVLAALALVAMLAASDRAGAQIVCDSATGPDVIVSDLVVIKKWGTVGNITGYSIGSNACNLGDAPLEWQDNTNRHPVIAMNAYRLRNGRFEQIGMSWLKHGFYALANSDCCACQDPGSSNFLGIGCSDVYDANLNGLQAGFNGVAGLGPRSEVNATTGEFPFPYGSQGQAGDAIYKRLQIHNNDLDPARNEGALYFGELQYITPDDAAAGNDLNNASYMPIQVGAIQNGGYPLSYSGAPRPMLPAIFAWQEFDTGVVITPIDVPGDGRFYLAAKASERNDGLWHYEYALFNLNSHRSARQLRIAIPDRVALTGIGFHDVDYHSGEPYDGTDWPGALAGGEVSWSTSAFDSDPNANALRFATMYTFRFNANAPPGATTATIGLFRSGLPNSVSVAVMGPVPGGGGPVNDRCTDASVVELGSTLFTNADADTDGPAFPCAPAGGASRDVWFRFTPTFTGKARISTCGSADFDNIIAVYSGCGCGGSRGAVIACSDDGCGSDAKVTLNVQAGECYLIRVAGSAGESGLGTLKIVALDPDNAVRADAILTGEAAGDRFGQSVGFAGDFKNDGVDDVIVGANRNDTQASNAGRATVGMGAAFNNGSSVGFSGENAGDNFGRVVAGGCDFDGDGYDEILVGAPNNDDNGSDAGKLYCFSGFDDSLLWIMRGQSAGDRLGSSVSCVGDVNNDSVPDVLVGAPMNDLGGNAAGRAYVIAGQDGSVISIHTGKAGEQLGSAVADLGDVNDDSVGDYAIGCPRSNPGTGSDAGRVIVYSGANAAALQVIKGDGGEKLGSAIAGYTGPVGAQTRSYLAIGAPNNAAFSGNAGRVRILMRVHEAPKCPQLFCQVINVDGQAFGDLLGSSVALGNVQGGSAPELLAGAPGSDANGSNSGAAYLINPANGTILRRIVGEAAGDALGTAVAIAGDINADGLSDYILGGPTNDAAGADAGRAYVYFSANTSLLRSAAPRELAAGEGDDEHANGEMFLRAAAPGDVDGDLDADIDDLMLIVRHWGACKPGQCLGDANRDGAVDAADLALVLAR